MPQLIANVADEPSCRLLVLEKGLQPQENADSKVRRISLRTIVALSFIFSIFVMGLPSLYMEYRTQSIPTKCQDPRIRNEWRTLTYAEKTNYIRAAQCLQTLPSEVQGKGSLYDDFVHVHMWIGRYSHASASFLPWHRAFIHIYESHLTTRCGLTIPLPYWNWELDHISLENSTIWDPIEGFGGDGSRDLPATYGEGRCVTDGPFANVSRLYWDGAEDPHCLSRSFVHFETGELGTMSGFWFSPETVGQVKRGANYSYFENEIEVRMHNALHWGMKGDFSSMASANEPLFWLHHAQLDRLWWNWQKEEVGGRLLAYEGVSSNTTEGREREGSLRDLLSFTGLWDDVRVEDVMDAEGGVLCYRYQN